METQYCSLNRKSGAKACLPAHSVRALTRDALTYSLLERTPRSRMSSSAGRALYVKLIGANINASDKAGVLLGHTSKYRFGSLLSRRCLKGIYLQSESP